MLSLLTFLKISWLPTKNVVGSGDKYSFSVKYNSAGIPLIP